MESNSFRLWSKMLLHCISLSSSLCLSLFPLFHLLLSVTLFTTRKMWFSFLSVKKKKKRTAAQRLMGIFIEKCRVTSQKVRHIHHAHTHTHTHTHTYTHTPTHRASHKYTHMNSGDPLRISNGLQNAWKIIFKCAAREFMWLVLATCSPLTEPPG